MSNPKNDNLDDRRAKLDAALAAKPGGKSDQEKQRPGGGNAAWGPAVKVSSEFIAGVLVGAGLGYLIDSILGIAPWGMIVFLLLGFCAGVLNVMRATGKVAEPDRRMTVGPAGKNNDTTNNGG